MGENFFSCSKKKKRQEQKLKISGFQRTPKTVFTLSVLVSKSESTKKPSLPNSAWILVDSKLKKQQKSQQTKTKTHPSQTSKNPTYPLVGENLVVNLAARPTTTLFLTETSVVTTFLVFHVSLTVTPVVKK